MQASLRVALFCFLSFAFCFSVSACAHDAISKDRQNSFLDADDMIRMTNQMSTSIATDIRVAQLKKPMIIVIKPIENNTNEIIRPGEKQMYVHHVQANLTAQPALRDQFVFVLNKADYEHLLREEGVPGQELGPSEERIPPEYALKGVFYAATNASNDARFDNYLCTYQLTKLSGPDAGKVLWEGSYKTSKHVKKEFLD